MVTKLSQSASDLIQLWLVKNPKATDQWFYEISENVLRYLIFDNKWFSLSLSLFKKID